MTNLVNSNESSKVLETYEQNLREQLSTIAQIKTVLHVVKFLPTAPYYNLMGSQSELERDLEIQNQILESLTTKLKDLFKKGAKPCL